MKQKNIQPSQGFIGRQTEQAKLIEIGGANESAIVIVYGRRRVGKTELLEQTYRKRHLIKIEGIEGKSANQQRSTALIQLSQIVNEPLLSQVNISTWVEFFEIIYRYVQQGEWTIYFEEVQWLADYQNDFISELKYVWDNYYRHNRQLLLVLCGSAPSFMINQVLHSKALYNRSHYEFPLREFSLVETQQMLGQRSQREIMDAYLTVGGIPEYLKRLGQSSSIFLGICENAFSSRGYLVREQERIFTSSMASSKHYKTIIKRLSAMKFLSRQEIAASLKIKTGGVLTDILTDLEVCGFIEKYTPYNLASNAKLARYCMADAYLQFYFKFIEPQLERIIAGEYDKNPALAIHYDTYHKWLGFSFERFCRRQHRLIAHFLGFSGINYRVGAFFNRAAEKEQVGYQIDLLFDRDDKVYTVCEIKYQQAPVGIKVIHEMEAKLALLPNPRNKTIHKVLICAEGADASLISRAYFDRVMTLGDFFSYTQSV